MAKSKELSGFEQMMEDIRNGNHNGGLMTSKGWANPDMSRKKTSAMATSSKSASNNANNASKASKAGLKHGTKRAHSAIGDDENKENQGRSNLSTKIGDDDPRIRNVTDDCDEVRERIEYFISRGEMTVPEFMKAIDVTRDSYLAFMDQDGPNSGINTSVYEKAWRFFKKRELNGIQMPPHKAAKKALGDSILGTKTQKPTTTAPKKTTQKAATTGGDPEKYDVSNIYLDCEDDGEVEIYETCDSLRAMVAAHLLKDDVVQAAFLREVSKCFGNKPKKISGAQLKAFMSQNGPHSGSSSSFFYGAYVYLEKLRIKNGKEISEFRQEMEERWEFRPYETQRGFPRKGNQSYFMTRGEELYEDEYGQAVVY